MVVPGIGEPAVKLIRPNILGLKITSDSSGMPPVQSSDANVNRHALELGLGTKCIWLHTVALLQ